MEQKKVKDMTDQEFDEFLRKKAQEEMEKQEISPELRARLDAIYKRMIEDPNIPLKLSEDDPEFQKYARMADGDYIDEDYEDEDYEDEDYEDEDYEDEDFEDGEAACGEEEGKDKEES